MANFWYVSSVAGTATTATARATTDITVQRTGAFTSMSAGDHFATVALAFLGDDTGLPIAGDFIFVANNHSFAAGGANIVYGVAAATDTPVIVMSVLETACDQYTKGASEDTGGSNNDISFATNGTKVSITGMDMTISDDFILSAVGVSVILDDLTLTLTSSADTLKFSQDGQYLEINNSTLVWAAGTSSACIAQTQAGAKLVLNNVIIQNGSGTIDDLLSAFGIGAGFTARFNNSDFSEVGGFIWGNFGADSVTDDNIDVRMHNCKVNSNADPFIEEDFFSHGQYFLATNCSDVAAEAEYQFYQKTMGGLVRDSGDDGTSGGIYRAESTAYTNGNKVSFKCTTSAQCGEGSPLFFDMEPRFADLTNSGTDALTLYIASATALTQANTWIEVSYPDATNKQLWKTTSSRLADILGTTALTADGGSSDWENAGTDLTTENEYKITVTAVNGAASIPFIRLFCTVPSITFYVDTTIDLS